MKFVDFFFKKNLLPPSKFQNKTKIYGYDCNINCVSFDKNKMICLNLQ